jgi:predicted ATPase
MRVNGRYELYETIGSGGMGVVYRGLDNQTGSPVAVKLLKAAAVAEDPQMVERFIREGEALRQLNHPNIVRALDTAFEDGQHYLVVEYVAGGSLRAELNNGPLPVERALQIALDLADALTRAHRLNIIHRDLKPANVLIAEDGTPRLTDFGVARLGGKEHITSSSAVLGTLDYLAPETLSDTVIDARADIWAFGVMLFEMLTGIRPFNRPSSASTLSAILFEAPPDLEALRPDCPTALADLVYRMLEKDRDARIPSIRLVGAELEALLSGRPTDRHPAKPSGRDSSPADEGRFTSPTQRPKHNLPAQAMPFIGREPELAELMKLLNNPQMRLVTIAAPGGMGKTRLALEAARAALEQASDTHQPFANGAYFVSLAPLNAAESIVTAIAEAVGFQFYGGDPKQQLLDFFGEKRLLLVLDNFEHLLAGAPLVSDLLEAAPGVKALATSRERLNLSGETLFNLGGLDLPEGKSAAAALEYSAARLFVQGAGRAQPGYELRDADVPHVARICRLVEGMPLGLLLAASWMEMLTPAEIASEIENSLDFLEANTRDLPERQRSLRAVFDYSWNLLSEAERAVFMKLAAFRGGFTRAAAEAVAGANLRVLMALVNKSLLRRDPAGGRYQFHELLRQYAEEQLAQSGQMEAAQDAHSRFFGEFLRQREADLKGRRQLEAGREIETDFENIRQAWGSAVQQGQMEYLDAFLYALTIWTYQRKQYTELIGLLDATVPALEAAFGGHATYGRLLVLYGQCLYGLGKIERAEDYLKRALAIAQAEGDAFGIAQASLWLARVVELDVARQEEVWRLCDDGIRLFEELGDDYELANALHYRGYLLWAGSKHTESVELNQQVYEIRRRLGDDIGAVTSLYNIVGSLYYTNPAEAEIQGREVLSLFERLGQPFGIAVSTCRLAAIELFKGNLDAARRYGEDSLRLARELGIAFAVSDSLVQLAWIAIASDHFHEAAETIRQDRNTEDDDIRSEHALLQFFIHLGLEDWNAARRRLAAYLQMTGTTASPQPISILGMGLLAAADGQFERALECISRALNETTSASYRMNMPLVKRHLSAIEAGLSEVDYAAAWERGRTMDVADVVAELLAAAD